MDNINYQENKSAGLYIFVAIFCLTIIVKVEDTGNITWMSVLLAAMYGGMVWGFGLALWMALGDMVMPYIYERQREEDEQQDIPQPSQPSQPDTAIDEKLWSVIDSRLSNGMFYARGAIAVSDQEAGQIIIFMTDRWNNAQLVDMSSYISTELADKLVERKVIDRDAMLTVYGMQIFPFHKDVAK